MIEFNFVTKHFNLYFIATVVALIWQTTDLKLWLCVYLFLCGGVY